MSEPIFDIKPEFQDKNIGVRWGTKTFHLPRRGPLAGDTQENRAYEQLGYVVRREEPEAASPVARALEQELELGRLRSKVVFVDDEPAESPAIGLPVEDEPPKMSVEELGATLDEVLGTDDEEPPPAESPPEELEVDVSTTRPIEPGDTVATAPASMVPTLANYRTFDRPEGLDRLPSVRESGPMIEAEEDRGRLLAWLWLEDDADNPRKTIRRMIKARFEEIGPEEPLPPPETSAPVVVDNSRRKPEGAAMARTGPGWEETSSTETVEVPNGTTAEVETRRKRI